MYNFPKVELHVHLDGSLNPKLAYELAIKDHLISQTLPYDEFVKDMVAPEHIDHLWEFLKCFDLPIALMQTKENIAALTLDVCQQLLHDNVCYAELRYAPGQHLQKGLTLDEVMQCVDDVVNEFNQSQDKCLVKIIHCMMIDPSLKNDDINWQVIQLTGKYLNRNVVAIDLAGPEGAVNMEYYAPFFAYAKQCNIPFTIHAGEVGAASNVRKALSFGTKRIGHGGNSVLDADVVQLVKESGALLEVCLSSNVQCKNQPSYAKHPIKQLAEQGVKCCINCDNRTLTNITLDNEYDHCINELGFSESDLIRFNLNAIDGAFIDESIKQRLRQLFVQ